jgi:hypothetical protein
MSPDEAGVGHYAVLEVEVDEGGAGEIEDDTRPETWVWRIGGALVSGSVVTQMIVKNTLHGKSYLSFLPPRVVGPFSPRFSLSRRHVRGFGGLLLRLDGWRGGGEGYTQIGADDVDDDLAAFRFVLGEAFEGIERAKPNRGLSWPSCSTALA